MMECQSRIKGVVSRGDAGVESPTDADRRVSTFPSAGSRTGFETICREEGDSNPNLQIEHLLSCL